MKIRLTLLLLLFFSVSANAINSPSNVKAVFVGGATVQISWSAVDNATGYNVYRNNSYLVTVSDTEVKYLDTVAGESYYVVAFDSSGSPVEYSNRRDSPAVTPLSSSPESSSPGDGTTVQGANEGFIFSRTDREEYRWIALADSGNLGSIWIDKDCADRLGSAQSQGNWKDLMALAPEFDAIVSPCPTDGSTGSGDNNGGFVFSRTDREEYRWIDTAANGTLGSVWIDKECADQLGGVSSTGNWSELMSLAPAFDAIDYPCGQGTVTPEPTAGFVFSRTDREEYRWIDVASTGGLGSIWIDKACAELLGPIVEAGDWSDLVALAPAFDAIDYPCDKSDGDGDTTDQGTAGGNSTTDKALIPATHGTIAAPPYSTTDPFGAELEINNSTPDAGGPSVPGNLRLDLLNNEWIQINWSPSVDDGEVVAYNIYRNDEKTYTIRGDDDHLGSGARDEIRRYWNTTSFIDCNYTHFGGSTDPLHDCATHRPKAGEQYTYSVTAVDNDGNESGHSNDLTARLYSLEGGSPVALYSDIYLNGDDFFPFATDFSNTNWLSQFLPVFSDEFNDGAIDRSKWNTELVWGSGEIINGEQQYFVNTENDITIGYDPFKFTSNSLVIEAIRTPDSVNSVLPEACSDESLGPRCDFLSGALATHDKFGMTYGYVEGRMKVSGGQGALSSFYLYHRYPGTGNQYHSPEIDIVEYLGENQYGDEDAFHVYHYTDPASGEYKSSPTMEYKNPAGELFANDFHTYGVLWEPGLIVWYIDGKEIGRLSGPQVGRAQMNIVTYLVAGSFWAPTPNGEFPLKFEIDYIRAYQRPQYICNNTTTLAEYGGDQQMCKLAFGV